MTIRKRRWIPLLTAIGGLAQAQATFTPDGHPMLSPQLTQAVRLKGLDPTLRKSAGDAKDATCLVSVWYNAEGSILAAQLLTTTGFPAVDQACLGTVMGQPLKVPELLDPDEGGWTSFPIHWRFVGPTDESKPPRADADTSIPALLASGPVHVTAPYYPDAALISRAHGICKLHVTISADGIVDSIEVSQSTGSVALDRACIDAIYAAPFAPARKDGKPAIGITDIALVWRLPVTTPPTGSIRH